jgi:hypothetical protein
METFSTSRDALSRYGRSAYILASSITPSALGVAFSIVAPNCCLGFIAAGLLVAAALILLAYPQRFVLRAPSVTQLDKLVGAGRVPVQRTRDPANQPMLPIVEPLLTHTVPSHLRARYLTTKARFAFTACTDRVLPADEDCLVLCCSVEYLVHNFKLSKVQLQEIAKAHSIKGPTNARASTLPKWEALCKEHTTCAPECTSVNFEFRRCQVSADRQRKARLLSSLSPSNVSHKLDSAFPPLPLSRRHLRSIVSDWCSAISSKALEQVVCYSCGERLLKWQTLTFPPHELNLDCLKRDGIATYERFAPDTETEYVQEPLTCPEGLIDDGDGATVCRLCWATLKVCVRPSRSLANGTWLGDVPDCLNNLSFMEKMLIAKYRHNVCVVRVDKGQSKMRANAVIFAQPVHAIWSALPPKPDDLSEILCIIFAGAVRPSESDCRRSPFLIRKRKVLDALHWLKLNHSSYRDITVTPTNLDLYSEGAMPVSYIFEQTDGILVQEAIPTHDAPLHDVDEADGTCPFAVHGLQEVAFDQMTLEQKKQQAVQQLRDHRSLGVGHSPDPTTTYNSPEMFAGLFPWLFPYGLGAPENEFLYAEVEADADEDGGDPRHKRNIGFAAHVQHLLRYHDRRFQTDEYFMFIAFNIIQLRATSSQSYVVAKRSNWKSVEALLSRIDLDVLQSVIDKSAANPKAAFRPSSAAEQDIQTLLKHIEDVSSTAKGSNLSKRRMRTQIKSIILSHGAPTFFITFAPVDINSPLCVYFAGQRVDLDSYAPALPNAGQRLVAIARNPVAGAEFFRIMVQLFTDLALGMKYENREGLFGKTKSYYGTVEAQGRMTLHLHCVVWLEDACSPKELRERIKADTGWASPYMQRLKEFLDATVHGQFVHPRETVEAEREQKKARSQEAAQSGHCINKKHRASCDCVWVKETCCLPKNKLPPASQTAAFDKALDAMLLEADLVIHESNRHAHDATKKQAHKCGWPNKDCKARFPRAIVAATGSDDDGHIDIKHLEPDLNTVHPILSWLLRCNTDVTCLFSGTAIKAILGYVTDYITKPALQTNVMFRSLFQVFKRADATEARPSPRKLLLQLCNSLVGKTEIGGPQVASYLFGHGDHYTCEKFTSCMWTQFVAYVTDKTVEEITTEERKPFVLCTPEEPAFDELGVLVPSKREYAFVSPILDYVHRGPSLNGTCLYDYVVKIQKQRKTSSKRKRTDAESTPVFRGIRHVLGAQHPQYTTHELIEQPPAGHRIPDFVGGSLPRRDAEDRDFYAKTMLTLFKPWTDPAVDLKTNNLTWTQLFDDHLFSERQQQLMQHFHLLHECADAKDDYRAQRAAARSTGPPALEDLSGWGIQTTLAMLLPKNGWQCTT